MNLKIKNPAFKLLDYPKITEGNCDGTEAGRELDWAGKNKKRESSGYQGKYRCCA